MMKFALVALAAVAFATPAFASTVENPLAQESVMLNLKGLDLATADGQQRLAIRMDQAARAVCGDQLSAVGLVVVSKSQECRAAVVADVRTQVEARLAAASTSKPVQFASAR
jgi:UrcA family protein